MVVRIHKDLVTDGYKLSSCLSFRNALYDAILKAVQLYNGEVEGKIGEDSVFYVALQDVAQLEKLYVLVNRIIMKSMREISIDDEINMEEYFSLYRDRNSQLPEKLLGIMHMCQEKYNNQKTVLSDGVDKPRIYNAWAQDFYMNNADLLSRVGKYLGEIRKLDEARRTRYCNMLLTRTDFWKQLYDLIPDVLDIYEGDKVQIVSGADEVLAEL